MSYNSRVNSINSSLRTFRDRIGALEVGSGPAPNGTIWTQSNVTSGMFSASCYGKGVWVAAGDTNLWWSNDGKTWTECTGSSGYSWRNVSFGSGIFIGSAYQGGLWYSSDGKSWTQSDITGSNYSVLYYDGRYWITDGIYRSTDGKIWTDASTFNRGIKSIYHYNNVWVAATTLYPLYSTDAFSSYGTGLNSGYNTYSVLCVDGLWVIGLANYGLRYSTNAIGKNWNATNVTSGTFYTIYNANGIWVAASSVGLYYSTDGMTWTQSNITTGSFVHVYNEAGVWVACSESKGLYYSFDGMTWTQSNLTSGMFAHVHNANGIWVACDGMNGLYYSVTWENS